MLSALVVVSHYNAWPADQLVALLDQMQSIPSGHPFRVRVVVNRAEDRPFELPERHAAVEVFTRENRGYNIGAWDHGWRQPPPVDCYLFVQEECVILRPGWLGTFVRSAMRPGVGIVGESLTNVDLTWDELNHYRTLGGVGEIEWMGRPVAWTTAMREYIAEKGIDPGEHVTHLQSLVVCARREVLEAVDGFPIGDTKDEAIACEIAMSRAVEAKGLEVRQVGFRPFAYIHHPQWEADRRASGSLKWKVRRAFELYLPGSLKAFRKAIRKKK